MAEESLLAHSVQARADSADVIRDSRIAMETLRDTRAEQDEILADMKVLAIEWRQALVEMKKPRDSVVPAEISARDS
jgi:hypothetical protein